MSVCLSLLPFPSVPNQIGSPKDIALINGVFGGHFQLRISTHLMEDTYRFDALVSIHSNIKWSIDVFYVTEYRHTSSFGHTDNTHRVNGEFQLWFS